jgi:hypothetical protein
VWYSRSQCSALASRKFLTSLRPKLKTSVPQSGARPAGSRARTGPYSTAGERPVVLREVRGDGRGHADPRLVEPVDECASRPVDRNARSARNTYLVAPGRRVRMLHHRHQLDVGEPHVGRVLGQLLGRLQVRKGQVALGRLQSPRPEVHLVDGDRAVQRLRLPPPREPGIVAPLVLRPEDDRRVRGRLLRAEGERVGLQPQLPSRVRSSNLYHDLSAPGTNSSQIPEGPSGASVLQSRPTR